MTRINSTAGIDLARDDLRSCQFLCLVSCESSVATVMMIAAYPPGFKISMSSVPVTVTVTPGHGALAGQGRRAGGMSLRCLACAKICAYYQALIRSRMHNSSYSLVCRWDSST